MNKWNLDLLFKSEEEFLKALEEVKGMISESASYKGKLNDPKKLREYLIKEKDLVLKINKVYAFAALRSDLNKKIVENNADVTKVQYCFAMLQEALSFEGPEILKCGKEYIDEFFKNNDDLSEFKFGFEQLFRGAKYVLDDKSEKLLSQYAALENEGSNIYSMLAVGDGKPRKITLSNGEERFITHGNWRNEIIEAPTAEDREKVFKAVFGVYEENKNTFGQIYDTVVQAELAEAKARGYDSILQSHLYGDNIPLSVYETLVKVASTNTAAVKKYNELRRKYLGLEKYHTYDRFLELSKSSKKYTFEQAKDLFFKSIEKFDDDFVNKAHEVLKEGYVDVYETEGKRTGAYSNGGQGIHPYILLNFDGNLDDVFTVAHESGHSIHTLYTMENQPLMLQDYTIFVAEIASTFNEHNLLDYLMESGELNKEDKILLLQKAIDEIMATFYRQTLFAQFELDISRKAEQGEPINYQVCNEEMIKLYKLYYDIDITEEEVKSYVWAYIPHIFYTPFYVYQYATSFSASLKLYDNVKKYGQPAFERYKGLLKAGGSKYPTEEAKDAGVDFEDPETFLAVTNRMAELVDELEVLLNEK